MIFFDIGATLIQGPSQTPARQLAGMFNRDDAWRKRLDKTLLTTFIDSPNALAELLQAQFELPEGCHLAAQEVWETQETGARVVPGAPELLEELRLEGVEYGFISNIWFPYAESFRRLYGELADSTDCHFSFRLGIAKPDLAFYRHALAHAGVAPIEAVMVGDSYDNDMEPALALGMHTVWLLHRPDKERPWEEKVDAGIIARPDIMAPSILTLTASDLRALHKTR
jgi:HAD superfamily hydrolase (TIGR01549 family)